MPRLAARVRRLPDVFNERHIARTELTRSDPAPEATTLLEALKVAARTASPDVLAGWTTGTFSGGTLAGKGCPPAWAS